jgi:serine/threonine protein kinase
MLSDRTLGHLRDVADLPDLSGTRYDFIAPLGRGGMGRVYRVRDRELDREVALKVLSGPIAAAAIARLLTEARVLARLEHPGIVPIHDAGLLPDGRPFYVMTLVRGSRLDELTPGLTSLPERLRLLARVTDAVAFAHARGIVHRDLTPSNIMIGAFGQVLVMDWGTAKVGNPTNSINPTNPTNPTNDDNMSNQGNSRSGEEAGVPPLAQVDHVEHVDQVDQVGRVGRVATGAGVIVGTPGFMAPEQERGEAANVDARADVYALGGLLNWLLDQANGGPREAPRPVAAIRDRAMRREPEMRYPTAEAFGAELARYLDGLPVDALRETALDRLARFGRTYRVAILLVLAYLLMRIVLLIVSGL